MNYTDKESESLKSLPTKDYDLQDTDLEDINHFLPEQEFCSHKIAKHKFVIGISKPGQQRIGLQTIEKNKITVKGILGIHKYS
ncbi:unnamed protein product [Paramecium sonneborni]|uniref:Uncharacterized protein n=1 Tax=Paramecium sonneborni TaxID=65129 RepID=A0A8S1Q8I4_9CILI|nr:unnamed protein product [Paramecium sonneborni]